MSDASLEPALNILIMLMKSNLFGSKCGSFGDMGYGHKTKGGNNLDLPGIMQGKDGNQWDCIMATIMANL